MRTRTALLIASTAVLQSFAASTLAPIDGRLQVISSAGIAESSIDFPSPASHSERVLSLSPASTLKIAFSTSQSSGVAYSSLILLTISPSSLSHSLSTSTNSSASNLFRRANSQIGSVSVHLSPKKGGKYRWEWDLSTTSREDILALARKGEGRIQAQIILTPSTADEQAVLLNIGIIHFSDESYWKEGRSRNWPREWEMDRYSIREELGWTFREPRKETGSLAAFTGLVAVLAPWLALLGLSSYILPGLNFGSSAAQIPFLLSLLALEGSIVSYWLGIIDVWAFMPAVGVVSISALLGGISALGQKTKERLGM
ncbi:MAG: hypothetical protein CYPHOPRED_004431 [Cyphobasidiales sp. Tagirdzhanova-0007]|nr:MAG: hypothetical protein CYPHOPRED_004431 [Cyphobasidiales sp. Tagirdzhanova-0007]